MSRIALFETVHGHLGVLAAAALAHPAILLRKGQPLSRGARWAVGLTTLAVTLAFASGLAIYAAYVAQVRPWLFRASARAGLLFETKEHVAFIVVASALGAGACALLAPRDARGRELRRLAAVVYAVGALLCLAVTALGSHIASVFTFAR